MINRLFLFLSKNSEAIVMREDLCDVWLGNLHNTGKKWSQTWLKLQGLNLDLGLK